jgi:hypothetical protein
VLRVTRDARNIDGLVEQAGDRGLAQFVVADPGHERDLRPGPRRRDGLVGTLSALRPQEAAAGHGLARRGNAGPADDEIRVHASDDDDSGGHVYLC